MPNYIHVAKNPKLGELERFRRVILICLGPI